MKWEEERESDNVVQGEGGGSGPIFAGGGSRLPLGNFRLNLKWIAVIVIVSLILGVNPIEMLSVMSGGSGGSFHASQSPQSISPVASNDPQVRFVKVVLGSTEDVWGPYFQRLGKSYEQPKLQLFNGRVYSACGAATAASGPFYCPGDHRIYLDLSFFSDLERTFGAAGDFARAYVIAHEVGHHVQELLGFNEKMQRARSAGQRMEGADGLSVRLELQADCLAGVWANHSEQQNRWLQAGDIEEALNAAKQIGDDLLETRAQGYAVPDSFTHGTSQQRMRWFQAGFTSGDIQRCDTFSTGL